MALVRITGRWPLADAERQAAEVASQGRGDRLKDVRAQIRELSGELDKVVNTAHGAEIAQAARRMQLEQLATRAVEEYAVEVDELVAEYGPDVPVPFGRTTTRCRCPTTGPRRRSGRSPRSGCSTSSARSTRWRWRSSPRWRNGTRSWSPSSRT